MKNNVFGVLGVLGLGFTIIGGLCEAGSKIPELTDGIKTLKNNSEEKVETEVEAQ